MNLFQTYLVEEFAEDYSEGRLSRREALQLILGVTGSLVMATSILSACSPLDTDKATALPGTGITTPTSGAPVAGSATTPSVTVAPDDPAIVAAGVEFPGEGATLTGYLSRPAGDSTNPVILVCHENRGLTEHIQDVTRRLAKAGYVALAVDLLSRQGGTGKFSSDQVPGLLGNTSPDQFVQDFHSGWQYLQGQPFAQAERVGMVGFCFGGGVTWLMATRMPDLLAAVPFYGPHPPVEDVPDIQAAILAIYAGRDQRINAGIPAIEAAMEANHKIYEKIIYPDVDHAFHNDTGPRYDQAAAVDAWSRTLDWFERYVRQR